MKEISDLNKLEFKSWNDIRYEGKKVNQWWGKTYFYYDKAKGNEKGKLFCETLSPIGRLLHRFFDYKKELNLNNLKVFLADKKIVVEDCSKNKFREVVGNTLKTYCIPSQEKEDFFIALESGRNEDELITFLAKIPNVNILRKQGGQSALWEAAFFGKKKVVDYLLKRNVDVNADKKNNPLIASMNSKNHQITLALLEKGSDVNVMDSLGDTVLHKAIANLGGNDSKEAMIILEAILKKKPEINIGGHHGDTPLYRACEKGDLDAVKLLISKGAKVDFYGDKGGKPPIYAAIDKGHTEVLRYLMQLGADVKLQEAKEWWVESPLYLALENHAPFELIKILVDNGADIKKMCHGESLLHVAVRHGDKECVEYLLEKGANPNTSNDKGETPLQCATRGLVELGNNPGSLKIIQLLEAKQKQ
jgi:ankyrin repeat protein